MCTVLRKDAGRRKARVLDSGGIYQAVLLFPSSADSVYSLCSRNGPCSSERKGYYVVNLILAGLGHRIVVLVVLL